MLVSKNFSKKLERALKKIAACVHVCSCMYMYVCVREGVCFPISCPKFGKKICPLFSLSFHWDQGIGLGMMESTGSGCARAWNLDGFPFYHVPGRIWPALWPSNHQSFGSPCWSFSPHSPWSRLWEWPERSGVVVWPLPGRTWWPGVWTTAGWSRSQIPLLLFRIKSHSLSEEQPHSVRKKLS